MKKNFFAALLVTVVVACAGYNIYKSQKTVTLSDLALANVEALAGCGESSSVTHAISYKAENGCFCISCSEPSDTNCKCVTN